MMYQMFDKDTRVNMTFETLSGPDVADARPESADEHWGENFASSDLYNAFEVKIIRSVASWDALETEWNELFAASPAASPPLRREWLRTWWDIYAPVYAFRRTGDEGLRIFTVWRNGGLIGVLPLYIRRPSNPLAARRLGFISTGEAEFEETCAENLGLLYLPDSVSECLQRLGAFLSDSEDWDELDLTGIAAGSPLLIWAQTPPHRLNFTLEQQGMCYIGDLSGGFEAYLQRLSRNGRSQARRAFKNGDNAGLRFEVAEDAAQAEQMFAELIALHQARWQARGKPGVFAAPRFEAFHRALLERGIEEGHAILTRLSTNNEPLAMVLGYCTPTKFDCYVHGTVADEREGIKSPGITGTDAAAPAHSCARYHALRPSQWRCLLQTSAVYGNGGAMEFVCLSPDAAHGIAADCQLNPTRCANELTACGKAEACVEKGVELWLSGWISAA